MVTKTNNSKFSDNKVAKFPNSTGPRMQSALHAPGNCSVNNNKDFSFQCPMMDRRFLNEVRTLKGKNYYFFVDSRVGRMEGNF